MSEQLTARSEQAHNWLARKGRKLLFCVLLVVLSLDLGYKLAFHPEYTNHPGQLLALLSWQFVLFALIGWGLWRLYKRKPVLAMVVAAVLVLMLLDFPRLFGPALAVAAIAACCYGILADNMGFAKLADSWRNLTTPAEAKPASEQTTSEIPAQEASASESTRTLSLMEIFAAEQARETQSAAPVAPVAAPGTSYVTPPVPAAPRPAYSPPPVPRVVHEPRPNGSRLPATSTHPVTQVVDAQPRLGMPPVPPRAIARSSQPARSTTR
jgi:hypothetical protein